MKTIESKTGHMMYGTVAAMLVVGTVAFAFSRPAAATVKFAVDTGKACGECHVSTSGGGKLTPFGEKFKANGNKLP